jgi:ADP-ribose pyrophosphatase YjhB (NUDIX family)
MTDAHAMKYCSLCGHAVSRGIPETDDRERDICTGCGHVHYENPKIIVCALPEWEDKVMLCKRAIEPRYGLWTLPGGFMELGESTLDAARRETFEEAGARIDVTELYALYHLLHIDQVHMFYRARLRDLDFAPGDESLDVQLFAEHEVPWDDIAFPAVADTLRHYFRDRVSGQFPLRLADVTLGANNARVFTFHDPNQAKP